MKKVIIMIALVVSAITLTKAQGGGGGGQQLPPADRAKAWVANERYATLALTEAQKTTLVPLLTKYYTSTDSLRAAANGDFQSMMPKMAAIGTPYEAKLVALLTADQKKAYDALVAAAKERNPNATGILGGGGRPRQ